MPDMRISLLKGETIPRDIKGRRIICCFCNDKGTWDTKTLEKFAKRFPEAKEWYLHKLPEQLRYPGRVLFCPGNNENTIVAIMICSTETADKYGSKIQFPYLYGCLLQAMVKAKQAEASVIVSKLGTDMVEWQWRKLIWILNHAAEMNEGVTAIAVSPYDLSDVFVEPKKKKSTFRKTKAKKDLEDSEETDSEKDNWDGPQENGRDQQLSMRPGMFARNLDFALRNCSDEQQMENVLFRFISVCKSIEPRVLVQLINHFRNRNNPVHLATGKANGAASKALERDIEPLSEDICKRVARDIFNQLWQVLRAEDTEPKSVYIDPDCHCNKLIFPDNPRQVTSAVRAAACGSRTNLPDGNVLRAFLYWKGNDGPDLWNGIDLDLSVVFYGEEKAKFVYYANPKDETLGAIHSGDRRCSGKNGAVEYVDFDIKKCFQNGFRYAALTVKSYSGEKFSEMENAFCGVMVRDGKTGEQFEPATVKDRFALTTDSDQLVMVVIDLMTREVITVDKSVAQFRLSCRNPSFLACGSIHQKRTKDTA